MNKVQQQIYDNVVGPALEALPSNLVAVVRDFDNLTQTGTITISSSFQQEEQYMYNVPLMNISGTKQSNPFPGDTVMVSFLGSTKNHPVMLGKIDSKHFLFTRNAKEVHFRAGSNITDRYNKRDGENWNAKR